MLPNDTNASIIADTSRRLTRRRAVRWHDDLARAYRQALTVSQTGAALTLAFPEMAPATAETRRAIERLHAAITTLMGALEATS